MKKIFILFLFVGIVLFNSESFGQQKISDLTALANQESADALQTIFELNVFDYFNLDTYNTELKKTVFKKTPEYQNYLTQLKSVKAQMLKTIYYVQLDEAFKDIDYNVKRGGFEISLGENYGIGTIAGRTPKSVEGVVFKNLSTKWVPDILGATEILFIPFSQINGLEIENNKQNIGVFFFFIPTGTQKSTFKFLSLSDAWYNLTIDNIYADNVRVVVANKTTGKIYYDNGELKQEFEQKIRQQKIKEQTDLEQQRKSEEEEKIKQDDEAKIKKQAEEEKLRKFLAERKATLYKYSEIESDKYSRLAQTVQDLATSIARNINQDNLHYKAHITFIIDTNNVTTYKIKIDSSDNTELENKLKIELDKIKIESCIKENYPVNAVCTINIAVLKSREKILYSIKYIDNSIVLKSGDNSSFEAHKNFIINEITSKAYPKGVFKIEYSSTVFNDSKEESLKVIEYKGFGGAGYSLLSLIVPGTGDYFVNRGKGSFIGKKIPPLVTTIAALGFVGTGIYFNSEYQKNYTLYHSATLQSDINNYYDLANGQHKTSWDLIGIGGIIWAVDIYWVIKKGIINKRESKQFKNAMQLSFSPSILNQNTFALNLNLKF